MAGRSLAEIAGGALQKLLINCMVIINHQILGLIALPRGKAATGATAHAAGFQAAPLRRQFSHPTFMNEATIPASLQSRSSYRTIFIAQVCRAQTSRALGCIYPMHHQLVPHTSTSGCQLGHFLRASARRIFNIHVINTCYNIPRVQLYTYAMAISRCCTAAVRSDPFAYYQDLGQLCVVHRSHAEHAHGMSVHHQLMLNCICLQGGTDLDFSV